MGDQYFLRAWKEKSFLSHTLQKLPLLKILFAHSGNWKKKNIRTYLEKHGRGFHEWKVNQKVRILLLNIRKTIILSPFSPSVLDEIWIFNLLLDNIIINVYIHTSYYHYRKKHTENSILFIVSDFLKMFTFFSV